MPLLFLVIFGIIEFGWGFYQKIDVRSGAREGSRLAAVNHGNGNLGTLISETCNRLDASSKANVDIIITKSGSGEVGDAVTVTIKRPLNTVTGFLDSFIGDVTLESTIKTRLEQKALYADEPSDGGSWQSWDDCG